MGLFNFGNRRRARVVCSGPQSGPRSGNFQCASRWPALLRGRWLCVTACRWLVRSAGREGALRSARAFARARTARGQLSKLIAASQGQVVLVKTMRYNHAVHTDAREAWFFFHRTPLARAGDRGR